MRPTRTEVTHYYEISREPDNNWPDIPWPDWKPETTKTMRPNLITFRTVNGQLGSVYVHGHRITAGGLGSVVSNRYYDTRALPEYIREIVEKREA